MGHGRSGLFVPDQRLAALRVAQVVAVGGHQIGRTGAIPQEGNVADLAPVVLVQDVVDHGEEEGRVRLGLDGQPLVRKRRRDGHVRLHLHPVEPPVLGFGMAPDPGHAGRRQAVVAEGEHVFAQGGVRHHDEGPVPELAVEMLRVVALDPLPGADGLVQRAPGRHEGREGAQETRRHAPLSQGQRQPGVVRLVHQPLLADSAQLFGHHFDGFVPGDFHPARVLVLALLWVGALERGLDAVGVVHLLDQAVGLHADAALGGVFLVKIKVGHDALGDAVLHFHLDQVRPRHALRAVDRDSLHRHGDSSSMVAFRQAARRQNPPFAPPSRTIRPTGRERT